jgi:hypothetical protein
MDARAVTAGTRREIDLKTSPYFSPPDGIERSLPADNHNDRPES